MGWLYSRMTHASVAGTGVEVEVEVEDTLVCLSVGIKHVDDLPADLAGALAAVPAAASVAG